LHLPEWWQRAWQRAETFQNERMSFQTEATTPWFRHYGPLLRDPKLKAQLPEKKTE